MPERIQLRRTKGWRKPEGAIVVARPSRWGNPYRVGHWVEDPCNLHNYLRRVYRIETAEQAVDLFRRLCEIEGYNLSSLRGRDLACWCPLDQPCHADVLLDLANREEAP